MHILIRQMWEVNGMTVDEIARELKISEEQVWEALKRD